MDVPQYHTLTKRHSYYEIGILLGTEVVYLYNEISTMSLTHHEIRDSDITKYTTFTLRNRKRYLKMSYHILLRDMRQRHYIHITK